MSRQNLHIFFVCCLFSLFLPTAQAQLTRYVKTTGSYANDGMSWEQAKNNLQDAINDLHNYMVQKGITEGGCVYVAEGTYVPTESTEQTGGGVLFTSFKMYAGISVYGGYVGTETGDALLPENREMKAGHTKPWELEHETILSGNHSSTPTTFEWEAGNKKETYTTSFPGNSYHVVWFATNGLDADNRGKALSGTALLDGFVVEYGNASNRTVESEHEHTAFGAGIYMVAGAKVDRCIVRYNESTRRGGGIYLDNGGEVDRCYIHSNQCLGLGIVAGYGGGVCVDDEGKVFRSLIHNNTARIGGGACLSAEAVHKKSQENAFGINLNDCFNPSMAGCVVSNNTSTTEAGGVFLYKGGQMNHNTIVRNKCTGPNVIISGRRYGRSAGVYVDMAGMINNSVLWGGKVAANNDVQYAAYTVESTEELYPYICYTAISQHDLADWTSTSKLEVLSLGTENKASLPTDGQYYPRFLAASSGIDPDNIVAGVESGNPDATPETRWMPAGFSPLREHGVQTVDIATYDHALLSHITTDMNGNTYAARTTIGAYVPTKNTYTPRLMPSVEPGETGQVLTFFVDPNRNLTTLSGEENVGHNWEKPLGNINDALSWLAENKGKEIQAYGSESATTLSAFTIENHTPLQILVKAGTCTTAGSYFSSRMRSSSIRMYDYTRIYGGYPADATGTNCDGRNPSKNLTTLSANIIHNGYEFNTCHILSFSGANNAIVDGFRLSYANSMPNDALNASVGASSPIYFDPALKDGGGIVIQDAVGNYGSMTHNKVRNCILSNCTSNQGAAIFIQSSRPEVEISIDFENCIIHNNTSTTALNPAAVWVESEATGGPVTVTFNHCDFLKNVGYGLYVKGSNAEVTVDNSIVWANASEAMDRSEHLAESAYAGKVRSIQTENNNRLTGNHNFIDTGAALLGLTNSQNTLTYVESNTTHTYPVFVNPTKNIGATKEGDLTKYGGNVKYMPRNMNPIVNAAITTGIFTTDFTATTTRSYGGAADVGAVENTDLPDNGKVYYVRDYRNADGTINYNEGGDGSSWSKAINGNAVYKLTFKYSTTSTTTADALLRQIVVSGAERQDIATTDSRYASTTAPYGASAANITNAPSLTNPRKETYVSGLQAAVEMASSDAYIAGDGVRRKVWVAAGTYNDWKGYIIRDEVDVVGSFPNVGNPGLSQRHPLLSEGLPLIESDKKNGIVRENYETILQISETSYYNSSSSVPISPSTASRHHVLSQPDICMPTTTQSADNDRRLGTNTSVDPRYVEYKGASWNGFTLRNGYLYNSGSNRYGGGGICIFRGVEISHCVVRNCISYTSRARGGGIYCDGENSVVKNSVIMQNQAYGTDDPYGGGIYMILGTGYNLLVYRNTCNLNGAGIFIENAKFYNNTIAYNTGVGYGYGGGLAQWTSSSGADLKLEIYNCILFDNDGKSIWTKSLDSKTTKIENCYISTKYGVDSAVKNLFANSAYGLNLPSPFVDGANNDYRLVENGTKCINTGKYSVELPDTDIGFDTRIQDCTVDIGAYEYNGAYDIQPSVDGSAQTATYYVTGPGSGTASATDVANAACMQKLQKVLDAAGRYKFQHPDQQVIVKLATIFGGGYAPSRSHVTGINDPERDNPRTFSLMVPRGVEVWGGYTDDFVEADRDIIGHKTLLTGGYTSDGQNVNCYHVVTFTNDLFDENGEKIGEGHSTTQFDGVTNPTLDPTLAHAGNASGIKLDAVKDRAILDGLYIEDGDAEGEITTSSEADEERYGGAAIVTEFAHVRNCILRNNHAANGGGALYLLPKALVSGCIMTDNTSDKGGAIYVRQNTADNFDPTKWQYIKDFAQVISCTISNNQATSSGGGLWFNNNVRVNSSVLWDNTSNNAANVNGQTDPFSTQAESNTSVFYPFSYSAVENIRMAGMNNISVSTQNEKGVRFVGFDPETDGNDYYYLQHFSVLARSGMSQQDYISTRTVQPADDSEMHFYFPSLEEVDMAGNSRTTYNLDEKGNPISPAEAKDFVEIGARAYNGPLIITPTASKLITRLFVVKPEDIDEEIYEAMSKTNDTDGNPYVEGCSFAFPMQKLDDALLYVQTARKNLGNTAYKGSTVKDTKFEIFVSRGTYYPYRTVTGQYSSSRGNTFLVPEGVSIYGGLRNDMADGSTEDTYYYTAATGGEDLTIHYANDTKTFKLIGKSTEDILAGRELEDLNHNSLMEPWEMKYQTILSGKSVNSETADNVYHVITCIADEDHVGTLPTPINTQSTLNLDNHTYEVTGVPILLDGLQIMDGKALGYDEISVANAYSYYKGGGILVDGNWRKSNDAALTWQEDGTINDTDIASRSADPTSVGQRSIPLVIRNCEFTNNRAGAGGAIYSNGILEIFSSNFAQNAAKQREDAGAVAQGTLPETSRKYHGNGGAVYSTYVVSAINTIFANNEAGLVEEIFDQDILTENGSRGGAVFHGADSNYGSLQMANCNFVRNQALSYPAIYLRYPNRGGNYEEATGISVNNPHKVVNSIFWGNEVRRDCFISDGQKQLDFVCSYWNNVPTDGAMVETPSVFSSARWATDGVTPGIGENLWFCAYEEGRGCEPRMDDRGVIDYRTVPYALNSYIPYVFSSGNYWENGENGIPVEQSFNNAGTRYIWVTNNMYLDSENNALNGPNFVNPSLGAGVANYLPSADWMMSRQNNLTDNGWSRIQQKIELNEATQEYDCDFVTNADGTYNAQGIYADTRSLRKDISYILMPIGHETYMEFTDGSPMYRISKDPNPSQNQTYIDLGVYEYQHIQLSPTVIGEQTDVLWVSTTEKPENGAANGQDWLHPTSDMQRAIETLLASRNNHHKQINVIEGSYSPIYTIDGYMSFTVNTGSLNAASTLPENFTGSERNYGILSLNILGGWSKDVKDIRDVETFPTKWEMSERSGVAQEKMTSLLRISDAHNWYGTGSSASRISETQKTEGNTSQYVIPIHVSGITFENQFGNQDHEGAGIYYAPQYQYTTGNGWEISKDGEDNPLLAAQPTNGKPKLTLGQCIAQLNGNAASVPAVSIGEGGGRALIYNSLFHSNTGSSLIAYNTHVVNCTFALNGGQVELKNDLAVNTTPSLHSLITNSLLWKNGAEDVKEYSLPGETEDYLNHNAIFGDVSVYATGSSIDEENGILSIYTPSGNNTSNQPLSDNNADVLNGPNFMNPLPEATSATVKEQRDFHLRPSARTINKGNDEQYGSMVLGTASLTDAQKSDETDLAFMSRFMSTHIDRGAYEYQGDLQRVVYVDPTRMVTGDGTNWGTPYGYGELQSAIDLAAVFTSVSEASDARAYVFCKGGQLTGETLTPRAGVSVYAGIEPSYIYEATQRIKDEANPDAYSGGYYDKDLKDYVTRVLGDRPGIVTPNAARTGITGMTTSGTYPNYALMDGFDITPATSEVTAPIVHLGKAGTTLPVILRNCVIHDVHNTSAVTENGSAAAVCLHGGMLYNVLVRDCDATADVDVAATWLGSKARAVNCTFVGSGSHGYALETVNADHTAHQVTHCITWNESLPADTRTARKGDTSEGYKNCNTEAEGYPFARYLQSPSADSHPQKPAVYADRKDLWYQLEEGSRQLDYAGTDFSAELFSDLRSSLNLKATEQTDDLIDFDKDRDLLGNPRLPNYAAKIDRGCYETWNIPAGTVAKATYAYTGTDTPGALEGGRRHPQEGSMVYLHANATLVMNPDDFDPESATAEGRNDVLRPGYLLLCEGASLYSEGAAVSLPHVGVERIINADAGALVALPYPFDYSLARQITYSSTTGQVEETIPAGAEWYTYDGEERAAFNYAVVTKDSPCWKSATGSEVNACTGVYYRPADSGTYRFTTADLSANGTAPVYREGYYNDRPETEKSVTLAQYDKRPSGSKPAYTTLENMGWNLVGCPYLVSNYPTQKYDGKDGYSPADYPMSLPRMVYTAQTIGSFQTTSSGKAQVADLSAGTAFFTQTATLGTEEALTFQLPHYTGETPATPAVQKKLRLTDGNGKAGSLELGDIRHEDDPEMLTFHLNQDGLHWSPLNPALPELYAIGTAGTRFSLLGELPTEKEIPLGMNAGEGGNCTFALPDASPFMEYGHVWLKDKETGTVTDLLHDTYTLLLDANASSEQRFTLQIGGLRPESMPDTSAGHYQVYGRQGELIIEGLAGYENIRIFDMKGRLMHAAQATEHTYRTPMETGIYAAHIQGEVHKVRVTR